MIEAAISLFLCVLLPVLVLWVGLLTNRVRNVEVLADRKASHIHQHMQQLIVTSLDEMREILKERLDQFLTMIEALETTSLLHTNRIDEVKAIFQQKIDKLEEKINGTS